jgi:hypothetical protein
MVKMLGAGLQFKASLGKWFARPYREKNPSHTPKKGAGEVAQG